MIRQSLIVAVLFYFLLPPVYAASTKNITLKDGSVIKGELVSYEKGIYTLNTNNLGRLQLPEANVVSVSNELVPVQMPQRTQLPATGSSGLSGQISAMQSQIMANPNTMQAVQAMAEDPEIMALISDPNFIKQLTTAVDSNNVESVANDPKLQKLMQNPKIQSLIQQLQQGQ